MDETIAPEACTTMAEVRAGVDAVDRELAALLARRFGYMRAAARIKPAREHVRDEARKRAVIEAIAGHARDGGWPEDVARDMWELLVERSIAYELARFDERTPSS